jgi:hypothetical protein
VTRWLSFGGERAPPRRTQLGLAPSRGWSVTGAPSHGLSVTGAPGAGPTGNFAVRDGKQRHGPALLFGRADIAALLAGLKAGSHDHLLTANA